jgi:hypothetical protein
MTTTRFSPFKSLTKTRCPELALSYTPKAGWRYVDITTGMDSISCVGPTYATKMEALADLGNYCKAAGWTCD